MRQCRPSPHELCATGIGIRYIFKNITNLGKAHNTRRHAKLGADRDRHAVGSRAHSHAAEGDRSGRLKDAAAFLSRT
jgi:hypothetical protein